MHIRPSFTFEHRSGFFKRTKDNKGGFQALSFALEILKAGHILAASLSDNHILDAPTGEEDTINALRDAEIPYAGAGLTMEHAMAFPTVSNCSGATPQRYENCVLVGFRLAVRRQPIAA
jgi:hypothetical protein